MQCAGFSQPDLKIAVSIMPIIQSCCCWRSLRRGCYASAVYTMVYFSVITVTMGYFIQMEQSYLNRDMTDPEMDTLLEPDTITPITVSLNITLLACSTLGLITCVLMIFGVYKDIKCMLLPWVAIMGLETLVEIVNLLYLFYLQTMNFNPISSVLFTLDFFIIMLNIYATVCVISQFQEYLEGRGTSTFDFSDRLVTVQYTATAHHTATTSSTFSGRRRSTCRPLPSRCDPDEFSEAPTKTMASVLSKPSRSAVKKHVQFPEETEEDKKSEGHVVSSLWMELESEAPVPER